MNVLWCKHPLTATEIFELLPVGHGWKPKTVNTFLTRLVTKGALAAEKNGKAYLYRPLIKREECVADEGESFLKRVFQGASGSLVLHFCQNAQLTRQEIQELEELLKAKKRKK